MTRLMLAGALLGLLSLAGCASMSSYTAPAGDVGLVASARRAPADSTSVLEHLVGLAAAGYDFDHVHRRSAFWTAPTTGSPAEYYQLEVESSGPSERRYQTIHRVWDTSAVVSLHAAFDSTRARVRAFDALHRDGPWSGWSRWYARGELVYAGAVPAIAQERQP